LVYQLGNLLASVNLYMQTKIAVANGDNYSLALALVAGVTAIVLASLISFSRERRGIDMTQSAKGVAATVETIV
jgi:SHS family lactate transporter-like MFS transporter